MGMTETAGIDFPLRHVLSTRIVDRLRDPAQTLPVCEFHYEWGLSYQKCRSCDRGAGDVPYLRKYGVRHYICEACLAHYQGERCR